MTKIPPVVRRFARVFSDSGKELFLVGGAVRDLIMNQPVDDFDFATNVPPETVRKMFKRVIPTGIKHGTVTVLFENASFEVTTYRVDGVYSDQRHPDAVSYAESIQEDLSRRDFTMNAIAFDPVTNAIVDPHGGESAIAKKVIMAVGNAAERFSEDALRMVRAVRFAAQLSFSIDTDTFSAIAPHAMSVSAVSAERIAREFQRVMATNTPSKGWRLFRDSELLAILVPELCVDQDIFEHLLQSTDCVPPESTIVRWAALFHDVGKPQTESTKNGKLSFHGHDIVSADIAENVLDRYRFSNATRQKVTHLIRNHMFGYESSWSDAAVRRFIHRVGVHNVNDLIALRLADICGKTGTIRQSEDLRALSRRVDEELARKHPLAVTDLAVSGHDLIRELNMPPGPRIGVLLGKLLETCLDDPEQNVRETLLTIARNLSDSLWSH